jgi:hypothetical protein
MHLLRIGHPARRRMMLPTPSPGRFAALTCFANSA